MGFRIYSKEFITCKISASPTSKLVEFNYLKIIHLIFFRNNFCLHLYKFHE